MARENSQNSFAALSRHDLTSALNRHKVSAILITLLLIPVMIGGVILIPSKFDSYGQLLVRLGRGSVSMDPTTSLTQTVSLQESRSSQVNSVTEMLESRALAERVVRRIGADRILESHSTLEEWFGRLSKLLPASEPQSMGELSKDEVAEQIEHENAVKALQSMFAIFRTKDAYTINLEVRSGAPFLSQDLLEAYMEEYQTYHVQAHRSPGSLEFFENQTKFAFAKAVEAQDKLRKAKTDRGIIEVEAAKSALRGLLSQAESDLLNTDSEIAATMAEQETLASDIDVLPAKIETEKLTGIAKVSGNTIRQSLYELEVKYQDLSSKLRPGHPQLNALEKQLKSAAAIAKDEVGDSPQTRESLNPIRQSLELNLRGAQSRLAGLLSKKASLESKLVGLREQSAQLNADAVELAQLSWQASLTESSYMRAAESRDQAKQLADLDSQNVTEISVVQPATLGLKKVKPQRSVLAVLAVLLAGTLGFGQALIRGLFDSHSRLVSSRVTDSRNPNWISSRQEESSRPSDEREPSLAGLPR